MKTDRTSALPPFFTQVIGSLPRPKLVRDLVDRRDSLPADEYQRLLPLTRGLYETAHYMLYENVRE